MFLPSLAGGGAERVFVELANAFAARGRPVDLVLAAARGPYLDEVSAQVRVVDLRSERVAAAVPALVRHLRANRPGALLSALDHANVAAVLARRLAGGRLRSVISMRAMPTAVYGRTVSLGSRLLFHGMRVAYPLADAVIANSAAVAADLSARIALRPERVHVIHNPLDLARIASLADEALPPGAAPDDGRPLILGVGALAPLKDFATLIRAFALARSRHPCRLVLLGEGLERARLTALAAELGVDAEVSMPGFVQNPFPWMRRARVLVSSSTTEGCPNAVMQALAVGTPVISTDSVGGAGEILGNGRWGRLVPVGDAVALAEAIGECLVSGERPDTRARASEFSHERVAQRYLGVLFPGENPA
jgi:glycosyltransferase involved in cell wall biosynthesis